MFPLAAENFVSGSTDEQILHAAIAGRQLVVSEEEMSKRRKERLYRHHNPKGEIFLQKVSGGR